MSTNSKFKIQNLKLKYRFLPNIATADLAFEAFGKNYNELFENAGLALELAQVDLTTLDSSLTQKIEFEAEKVENLLFRFLEELVFLKDAKLLIFNTIKCKVSKSSKLWVVSCKLNGEKIDREKHKLGVDVKAVTKHLFKVEKIISNSYRCQVVLDV